MNRYLIYLLLLFTIFNVSAQTPILASIETNYSPPTPVEKRKIKKKKRQKKQFKKPDRTKSNRRYYTKRALAISFIISAGIGLTLLVGCLIQPVSSIILIVVLLLIIASILFIAYICYEAPKKEDTGVLKTEQDSRAEVAYLEEKDILDYLALNKELTMFNVRKNTLLRSRRYKSLKELREIKKDIKALDVKIKRVEIQLNELRRQNKINKVLKSRT